LKVPPTVLPSGTSTLKPISSAESIRFASGLPSISRARSWVRWIVPLAVADQHEGAPLVVRLQILAPRGGDIAVGERDRLRRALPFAARLAEQGGQRRLPVSGAKVRQVPAKRANCTAAVACSSGPAVMSELSPGSRDTVG
jgi:hypothetical protein